MTTIAEQTLASIVTNDHATVPVLEKYGLDFCCKGKRTLAEACRDKGLSLDDITQALQAASNSDTACSIHFSAMNAEQLISYILIHHHFYVKQAMPTILGHLEKVATKHGDRFPYMVEVYRLFTEVKDEMTAHMHKEEAVLFPRIKEVEALQKAGQHRNLAEGYLNAPIQVMEMEHDHAGELLYKIRELTNEYTAPGDACTTFRVSLAELKHFEEDLHKHVHMENNLLFPLAENLIKMQVQLN